MSLSSKAAYFYSDKRCPLLLWLQRRLFDDEEREALQLVCSQTTFIYGDRMVERTLNELENKLSTQNEEYFRPVHMVAFGICQTSWALLRVDRSPLEQCQIKNIPLRGFDPLLIYTGASLHSQAVCGLSVPDIIFLRPESVEAGFTLTLNGLKSSSTSNGFPIMWRATRDLHFRLSSFSLKGDRGFSLEPGKGVEVETRLTIKTKQRSMNPIKGPESFPLVLEPLTGRWTHGAVVSTGRNANEKDKFLFMMLTRSQPFQQWIGQSGKNQGECGRRAGYFGIRKYFRAHRENLP